MQFEFDPELLIDEIRRRPGIWDREHVDHRSREIRSKLWREIIDVMLQDQKITKSEKRELELQLQKKWKGMRDAFSKYLKNTSRQKRPYIYSNQMAFLYKKLNISDGDGSFSKQDDDQNSAVWRQRKKLSIIKNEESDNDVEIDTEPQYLEEYIDDDDDAPICKIAKTEKSFNNDFAYVNTSSSNKSVRNEFMFANVDGSSQDDCDKMFLLSLLPHLKSIPEEYRLNAKMELLQVLQNANKIAGEIERP